MLADVLVVGDEEDWGLIVVYVFKFVFMLLLLRIGLILI